MANKKTTGPESPVTAEQQIEQLRDEKKVKRAVFVGVCAAEGWKPGKTVTEKEFLEAVEKFTSAPMSGAAKKEAGK